MRSLMRLCCRRNSSDPVAVRQQPLSIFSRNLIWLFCLAAIAAGAHELAAVIFPRGTDVESLSIPASRLGFGEVWEDKNFVWNLPITNRGPETLQIQEFFASCGCIGIEPKSLEIPAQATRTIQVTVDLTRAKSMSTENARPFSATIGAVVSADPPHRTRWTISGNVRKVLDVVPPVVYFEEGCLIEGQAFPSKTVAVSSHAELTGLAAECRPPLGTVAVVPGKEPGTFSVTITPNKGLPAGTLEFEVDLCGRPTVAKLPPATLSVRGKVLQEIEALPQAVLFSHRVVGERADDTVLLRSRTGKAFTVLDVQSNSECIQIERLSKSSDPSQQFRLQETFRKTGPQSTQVSFCVLIDGRRITVTVPVRYYGIAGGNVTEVRDVRK